MGHLIIRKSQIGKGFIVKHKDANNSYKAVNLVIRNQKIKKGEIWIFPTGQIRIKKLGEIGLYNIYGDKVRKR